MIKPTELEVGDSVIFKAALGRSGAVVFLVHSKTHSLGEPLFVLTDPLGKETQPFPISMLVKSKFPYVYQGLKSQ